MSSYRDDLPSSTTLEPDRWVTRMEGDVDEEDEYDQPDLATTMYVPPFSALEAF